MSSKKLRLAIGSEAKRESSIWRIWSNYKGDIYIANRIMGGIYKMSLHKDGKCQFGFTKEYAETARERFGIERRHLELWKMPDDAIVRAVQILIPASELRKIDNEETKKIMWLQPPPDGAIGTISVFICKPNVLIEIPKDSEDKWLIGKLETSIRNALITYAFTYPDKSLANLVSYEKDRFAKLTETSKLPSGSRAVLWDSNKGHDRHILELACD